MRYFPGSLIIKLGQKTPGVDLLQDATRKYSIYAHFAVMNDLGTRPPQGWTPAEEAARNQKIELEITIKRNSLNILK